MCFIKDDFNFSDFFILFLLCKPRVWVTTSNILKHKLYFLIMWMMKLKINSSLISGVDCVRGIINKPEGMEKLVTQPISYVLAFGAGNIFDFISYS